LPVGRKKYVRTTGMARRDSGRGVRALWFFAMLRESLKAFVGLLRDAFRGPAKLVAENALLRQEVIVLGRGRPHPRLKPRDRWTLAALTRFFPALLDAVTIVRPETVIRWHRSLWRLVWRHRSQRPVGRPPIDADTRALIRRMWQENPLWGEDVIPASLPSSATTCPQGRWPSTDRRTCPVGEARSGPHSCGTISARPGQPTGSPS